jgi:glutamate-1-semialdehyde 2,1-aminomutase
MAAAAFIAASSTPCTPHVRRAAGARVWGDDGAVRLDFDMGGGSILLGHAFAPVEEAVAGAAAADAERAASALIDLVPCARAVRFTAEEAHALPAAIAAARVITGRRRALVWEPASGPLADASDIAALVLDPMGLGPHDLQAARRLADDAGAVLIFDEGVSGFRVAERGVQGLNGVVPDMAVYGAGLANGRPIGAVAGAKYLIAALDEDDLSEPRPASLAAAAATLFHLAKAPPAPDLRILGAELQAEVASIVERSGAGRFFALEGDPALPTPLFAAPQLEGLLLRETARRNLIVFGPHGLSAAHGEAEVAVLVEAYAEILPLMVASGLLESLLRPQSSSMGTPPMLAASPQFTSSLSGAS